MGKAKKYQRFAEECMELARTAKDAQARAVLLHMAEVWVRLAASQTTDSEMEDAS
jgi:diacylglycerol kinase